MNSFPARQNGTSNSLPAISPTSYTQAVQPPITGALQTIEQAHLQLKAIRTFVKESLVIGIDYGKIPGCGDKPALFLAGAQKAAMFFNGRQDFANDEREIGDGHLEVVSVVSIVNRANNEVMASGVGSCCTMEKKYRYRNGERRCPNCNEATIIKGQEQFGGGWLCYIKKGGCGAKFADNDPVIIDQHLGQVANPDIYDLRNTVRKMAMKRGSVHAAMNLACLSELFTQDIEDTFDEADFQRMAEPQLNSAADPADETQPGPMPTRPSIFAKSGTAKPTGSEPVKVIGQKDSGPDGRAYHAVVADAATAIDVKVYEIEVELLSENAARKAHKVFVPTFVHEFLINRAVQKSFTKPPKSQKLADLITALTAVYATERDWLRGEINGYANDLYESTRVDCEKARKAKPAEDAASQQDRPVDARTLAQAIPHEITEAERQLSKAFPKASPEATKRLPQLFEVKRSLLTWAAEQGWCVYNPASTMPSGEGALLKVLDLGPNRDAVWQEMYRLVDTSKDVALAVAKTERDGDDGDIPY